MTIVRAPRPEQDYTTIRNNILRDESLSYRARGVLSCILSYPDNWETNAEKLSEKSPEGRDAIRTALRELVSKGYIVRKVVRDKETGQVSTKSYVHEKPVRQNTEDGLSGHGSPTTGNPTPGNPAAGKPGLLRITNKEILKEDTNVSSFADAKRNVIWDALQDCFGKPTTKSSITMMGKAAAELKQANATPQQIKERYAEAKKRWDKNFSPMALLKHWDSLAVKEQCKSDLKGNAQIGKDFLTFDYKDDDELLKNLGAEVYDA